MTVTSLPKHKVSRALASRVYTGGTIVTAKTAAGLLVFEMSANRYNGGSDVFRGGKSIGPSPLSPYNTPFWYRYKDGALEIVPQAVTEAASHPTMESGIGGYAFGFRLPYGSTGIDVGRIVYERLSGRPVGDVPATSCAFWDTTAGNPPENATPSEVFVVARTEISGNVAAYRKMEPSDRRGAIFSLEGAGQRLMTTAFVTFTGGQGSQQTDADGQFSMGYASIGNPYDAPRSLGVTSGDLHAAKVLADLGLVPNMGAGRVRYQHPGEDFYPAYGLWLHGIDPAITFIRIPLTEDVNNGVSGLHMRFSPGQVRTVILEARKSADEAVQAQLDQLAQAFASVKRGSVVRASFFGGDVQPQDIIGSRMLAKVAQESGESVTDLLGEVVSGRKISSWRELCLARPAANGLVWVENGRPVQQYVPTVANGVVSWAPEAPVDDCFAALGLLSEADKAAVLAWASANGVELLDPVLAIRAGDAAVTLPRPDDDIVDIWWKSYGFRELRGLAGILAARSVVPDGDADPLRHVAMSRLLNVPLGSGSYIRTPINTDLTPDGVVPAGYTGAYVRAALQHDSASWSGTGGRAFGVEVWRAGARVSSEIQGTSLSGSRILIKYEKKLDCQPGDVLMYVYASVGTAETMTADITLLSV